MAADRQPVTFFGENIGDANGLWLLEFWNKSIVHDWTLDASAPRPDPTLTPDVKTTDGRMHPDAGTDYALTSGGVEVQGHNGRLDAPGSCCAASRTRGDCRRRCSDAPATAGSASDALYVQARPGPARGHGDGLARVAAGFCNQSRTEDARHHQGRRRSR